MILYDLIINHPGRNEASQYFDNHCTAATPPSKGGETLSRLFQYKTTLNLTAMPQGGLSDEMDFKSPLGDLGVKS
jgi:hypothetical protein